LARGGAGFATPADGWGHNPLPASPLAGGGAIDDGRTGTGKDPLIRMSLVIHNLFSEIRCGEILHLGSFILFSFPYSRLRRNIRCFPVLRTRNKKW
jgi:hypothetical protein